MTRRKTLPRKRFRSGGHGTRTRNPSKGHLISSEAANQFAYPPEYRHATDWSRCWLSKWNCLDVLARLIHYLGAANEIDELVISLELGQFGGQLFHGVDGVHGGKRTTEHGNCMKRFGRQ